MRYCKLEALGHEAAAASGLANPTRDGWVNRLRNMAAIPEIDNRAAAGAQYAAIDGGTSIPEQAWAGDRSQRGAPYLSGSALVVLDGSRGDLDAYGQPNAASEAAFKHGVRNAICEVRCCERFPANDADLTYSGSWASLATDADWPGGQTRAAGANADYVELDVPADWPGGFGYIVCPEDDSANGAVFTVVVDGVTKGTLDTRTAAITGTVCPATLRFEIPASAAGDTIRATVGNFATAAKFSHIGLEVPAGSGHSNAAPYWTEGYTPPVVVTVKDPRPASYGATGHHDGQWEAWWLYQQSVVQEFATDLVVLAEMEATFEKVAAAFQAVDIFSPSVQGHAWIADLVSTHASVRLSPTDQAMLALPPPASAAGGYVGGGWKPAHHDLKGASFNPIYAGAAFAAASGYIHLAKIWLEDPDPIDTIHWVIPTTPGASLTTGQCFGFIYASDGTLLAKTADLSASAALTAAGEKSVALVAEAGESLPSGGDGVWIHAGLLVVGSTMPQLAILTGGAFAPPANFGLSVDESVFVRDGGGNTSVPATRAVTTGDTTRTFWMGVS